ncbi:hypothetical protein B0H19DRAFT_1245675 [Mycena capillaripes]|nr:hypothetical protein B0H19DRAFT_1245675 [Mycena capillaripes]
MFSFFALSPSPLVIPQARLTLLSRTPSHLYYPLPTSRLLLALGRVASLARAMSARISTAAAGLPQVLEAAWAVKEAPAICAFSVIGDDGGDDARRRRRLGQSRAGSGLASSASGLYEATSDKIMYRYTYIHEVYT